MPLEPITYISDLVTTNPDANDGLSQADDHLKGIKTALRNTLVNATGPINATPAEINLLVGKSGSVRTTANPTQGEWRLLANVTPTVAANIDLVHGVGGVVIDTNYDEYMLDIDGVGPALTAEIRMFLTSNLGSTWALLSGDTTQYANIISGTASAALFVGAYVPLTGQQGVSGGIAYLSGSVRLRQRIDTNTLVYVISEAAWANVGVTRASMQMLASTAFNGIRLSCSTGNFQTQGRVRLWGRRFT